MDAGAMAAVCAIIGVCAYQGIVQGARSFLDWKARRRLKAQERAKASPPLVDRIR